ncbi:MAG: hypothetical protein A3C04_00715 [Candidatus Wildermuthbacteria bacterium RIFCSPHIGHO2_02_FULL_45_25]|uniref:Uncharacterized protein n=1 Tax=Candidatus Wildermuthbacteria bacterium RIFCSPHIGHO2_02_FULL_45_25 TaxID=1802450 RepID=A0A1G2R0H0_9BACT|nr:MAG: hypothetical protein A3C04_00715 [Candidatus Wildermuthbacteria bacterium RIFCSPHIGHO2_02_FULL_45_25]
MMKKFLGISLILAVLFGGMGMMGMANVVLAQVVDDPVAPGAACDITADCGDASLICEGGDPATPAIKEGECKERADGGGGRFVSPGGEETPTGLLNSVTDLQNLINTITNWFFFILITVAVIFIILAAMQFITAGGDSAKVSEARSKLIWAAVGIGIAVLAKSIPVLVKSLLGVAAS